MIISRGRGYVFVHIPKTGGTALAAALESRAMRDDILIGDTPKARARRQRLEALRGQARGRLWKHSTLADIAGVLPEDELGAMLVASIVRNPWDRMVSLYHWLRVQSFGHRTVTLAQNHDFAGFLGDPLLQASVTASPYGSYVRDVSGAEPHKMIWLRQETLAADAEGLAERLSVRLDPLAYVNGSERSRDWRGFYSDETAAIVSRIAAEDISRFGYRFDP